MNKHLKQELVVLTIVLVIVFVGVILAWLLFKDSLSPEMVVIESTIERVDKKDGTITVDCVQSKVDDISKFKEGQKVKVWFLIPRNDEDVWKCDKNKIENVKIME